jgi:pyruvate/2-oxoglutarate dehydrogenase complex dihydrolipoamide acyltransferase (E2) component
LAEHRERTGEAISFTAFVVHCLAAAVAVDPMLQAYRAGSKLVVFDDVDVNVLVETELEGRSLAIAHVLRAAQKRSVRSLHDEIRSVQSSPHESYSDRTHARLKVYTRLPAFARDLLMRVLIHSPHRFKALAGTISVTAVGMFGDGGGWGVPLPVYTSCLTIGGITRKPALRDGRLVECEFLCLTLTFDHDIVDGGPGARLADRLSKLIEIGDGLDALENEEARTAAVR